MPQLPLEPISKRTFIFAKFFILSSTTNQNQNQSQSEIFPFTFSPSPHSPAPPPPPPRGQIETNMKDSFSTIFLAKK
jgi:hypothetical protein